MRATLRLDIPVVLPEVPDAADACVARLIASLEGRDGIAEAHVVPPQDGREAQLCVHYDPDAFSLARISDLVKGAG
ncbi:hypothetical protein, partial [Klebsiella aerogenes]